MNKIQTITWIEFPRAGTSVLAGNWLATVETGTVLATAILQLDEGQWFWPDGRMLSDRERVVAIAYIPEPYRPS